MIVAVSLLGWIARIAITLVAILVIYVVGAAILAKFKIPPPAEPDPDQVVEVALRFRCVVCGAEVVMTAAQANMEIEAPRHCREDMVLVGDA
ncbi:MAG: hypothetical protein AMXMBFR46_26690 [Acidimicrobiia bacterium]